MFNEVCYTAAVIMFILRYCFVVDDAGVQASCDLCLTFVICCLHDADEFDFTVEGERLNG